jgi:hypothetical protein
MAIDGTASGAVPRLGATAVCHLMGGMTMNALIAGVLVLWLAVVLLLGALGTFERPPGTPPVPILIGVVGPLVVFIAAYWGWANFRAFWRSTFPWRRRSRSGGLAGSDFSLYMRTGCCQASSPGRPDWATSQSASPRRGSPTPSSADPALQPAASSWPGIFSGSWTLS